MVTATRGLLLAHRAYDAPVDLAATPAPGETRILCRGQGGDPETADAANGLYQIGTDGKYERVQWDHASALVLVGDLRTFALDGDGGEGALRPPGLRRHHLGHDPHHRREAVTMRFDEEPTRPGGDEPQPLPPDDEE